ncbi:hypothetical protein E4T42_09269 [Aureobasidium subglaciale]|nr:hypothetical protein E4T42_09269 [Aureobasidium subglaciale]
MSTVMGIASSVFFMVFDIFVRLTVLFDISILSVTTMQSNSIMTAIRRTIVNAVAFPFLLLDDAISALGHLRSSVRVQRAYRMVSNTFRYAANALHHSAMTGGSTIKDHPYPSQGQSEEFID